jgi:hypothetical protein
MADYGHWNCTIDMPDTAYGFIYRIADNETGKFYIGKKQILSKRRIPALKGKKNRRTKIIETDWKSYTSSSRELNEDIDKYGKDRFLFEIVRFCKSKWELAYFEAKYQFAEDVLVNEKSYNGIINLRIGKAPKSYEK